MAKTHRFLQTEDAAAGADGEEEGSTEGLSVLDQLKAKYKDVDLKKSFADAPIYNKSALDHAFTFHAMYKPVDFIRVLIFYAAFAVTIRSLWTVTGEATEVIKAVSRYVALSGPDDEKFVV